MENLYIIGDVHGCYQTLLALVAQLPQHAKLVFVGDLIDRGPASKQVVDFVMKGGHDCVIGNHEEMMNLSKEGLNGDAHQYFQWLVNGGVTTLASYTEEDGRFDKATFEQHISWMANLPLSLEYKDIKNDKGEHLLVSHSFAGNVWEWNEERRTTMAKIFRNNLLWGRPKHLHPIQGVYQVHGHTPLDSGPLIKSFYANIDTGAVFKDSLNTSLTALEFPSMKVYSQSNVDSKSVYWR